MGKLKKYVALASVFTLLMATITGCGGENNTSVGAEEAKQESKDMETVSVYLPQASNFTEEGIATVEEEMNKIFKERYNVQVDLNYISLGNWVTQSNLALTTDECDVITLVNSPLTSFVRNGQLAPLTSYYENASNELKDIFSEDELKATTFDGEIYSLPRKFWAGTESALFMSEKIVNEMGIDISTINSLEAVDKVLYQVHEAYPDIYTIVPAVEPSSLLDIWYYGDGMSDDRGRYGVVPFFDSDFDENNMKVKSLYETEKFKEICEYTHKWYSDGLVLPDVLSNTIDGGTYIKNGQAFAFMVRQQGNGYKNKTKDGMLTSPSLGPSINYSYTNTTVTYGISSNSKHKDAAWTVLQSLYMDSDIVSLLADGVDGVHTVLQDDGTATFPEGVDRSNCAYGGIYQFWIYPNTMICPPSQIMGKDYVENLKAYSATVEPSPIVGFQWDSTDCTDEMTAVSNIHDKYYKALMSGVLDPKEVFPKIIDELKQAGMDKIIASEQEQLDEFLKSK
ncbi:ABC transporter substrate-binding protein [Clostridium grantii]|uniref:ABC-type glycerol-3-phosphate transport system, substrate-binding protein n=1 Tax=Clostridium grantii DSM 8605 TaxID=1121316 RepID=A0A1M5XSS8_9CLOT|nr:ABC transporter substrate-binding protein [Clostridium grantii]SHI02568.1 ABC-type glycerol-3-phosphate transport system, substrate-binding protein [Clostridium grantii DSM 8605]